MARIKTSAFINDISGKIGGTVFQRCQSGLIMKNSPNLSFASSQLQNNINQYMYRCQYEWQHLTECQRQIWNSFASFTKKAQKHSGNIFINGHQLFIQCNFYRYQYGFTTLQEPQFIKGVLSEITGTIAIGLGILRFITDRTLNSTYEFIILQATTKVPITINNCGSRYRTIVFTTTDTHQHLITSEYQDVFGFLPVNGDTLFCKYTIADKRTGLIQPFKTKKITF